MNVLTKACHFKNHKTSTREQVLKFLKKKKSHTRISVLRHLVLAHGLTSKKKKKKKFTPEPKESSHSGLCSKVAALLKVRS